MTTMTIAAEPAARPVPWRPLFWVAWRRYRATLTGTVGFLALIAGYLAIDGLRMRTAYATYLDCRPVDAASCQHDWQSFRDGYAQPGLISTILVLLPGIVGAFAGAPLLARELETGTFRYLWTQAAGRMRWAIAGIISGALGAAVVMAAFGALVSWHDQPLTDSGLTPRLRPTVFPITGVAAAGWALAGFAIGVLAGLLWRRVLPALASAIAAWFGLAVLGATVLRGNYLAPLTGPTTQVPDQALILDQWWSLAGVRVDDVEINAMLRAADGQFDGGGGSVQYLAQHGYAQLTSFQPDGRYWTFQWIEFGWLSGLTLVLLGAALWLLRRRPG